MLMQIDPIRIFMFSFINFHSNIHAEIFQILNFTLIFKSLFYSFLFFLHMLHAKPSQPLGLYPIHVCYIF